MFREFLRAFEEEDGDIAARGEIFQGRGLSAMKAPHVKLQDAVKKGGQGGDEA